MADRGGLSSPTEYCYAVCAIAVNLHTHLMSAPHNKEKILLSFYNQCCAFVKAAVVVISESKLHNALTLQECSDSHRNFKLLVILQIAFLKAN